jgi:hypothetical protein
LFAPFRTGNHISLVILLIVTLVKNLAMFGLGINIYSGEDLPLNESDFLTEEEKVLAEKNHSHLAVNLLQSKYLFQAQT